METVKLGNTSATLIRHCDTWDHAMWTANYMGLERGFRYYVTRCKQSWSVWQLNHQRITTCSQCGFTLQHRACGPTHAILWHEQRMGL